MIKGHPRSSSAWLRFLVAVAAIFFVFVLPLLVRSKPVYGISAAYLAGFNNSVAVLGAAGLSAVVFLIVSWGLRNETGKDLTQSRVREGIGKRFVAFVIAGSSLVLAFCCSLVAASGQRYLGDAGYFVEQASTWSETGRHLYSQIEFAYGPLLLLPTAWVARLFHVSIFLGYSVAFVIESALGLVMLAYVLGALPIRRDLGRWAFVLLALGAITPHLGMNYTYFRFASPLATLLFVSALPSEAPALQATAFCLGIALELAISPELAFALAVGIVTYASVRAKQAGLRWLWVGLAPCVCLAALLATVARPYLRMVATFSRGVYNLPVGPYPHVLIYLVALLWLVPVGVAHMRPLNRPEGVRLLAAYAVCLGMVPAALSRCDPLHILFNGIGILVLSLVWTSQAQRRTRVAWIVCLGLLILWEQRVNTAFFAYRSAETVQRTVLPHLTGRLRRAVVGLITLPDPSLRASVLSAPKTEVPVDIAKLIEITEGAPIATPLEITPFVEEQLKGGRLYSPMYHAFGVDMGDLRSEQESVNELRGYRWMLLPTDRDLASYQLYPQNVGSLQGMRMYFRQRRPVLFVPGAVFEQNIQAGWRPVLTTGPYTLYAAR